MNYKKYLFFGLTLIFFLMTSIPSQANNIDPEPMVKMESLKTKADFELAFKTLKEHVQALDVAKKEATTKADKDMVKKQIKETKKEIKALKAKALNGGIYIGSGALVVILLLIILL